MTRGPQTIYPALRYQDADGAMHWLREALGFADQVVYRSEEGAVEHAQLTFGGDAVMVGTLAEGERTGPSWLYLVAGDIDGLFERAVAAGAEVVHAPQDRDYGSREFTVRDPGGNSWSVGTYQPADDPGGAG